MFINSATWELKPGVEISEFALFLLVCVLKSHFGDLNKTKKKEEQQSNSLTSWPGSINASTTRVLNPIFDHIIKNMQPKHCRHQEV